MLKHFFIRNTYFFRIFKYSSQSYSVSKFLNQIVVQQYCTSSIVSFETPAVKKYLSNLVDEYQALQAENESGESNNILRIQEIQPVINIINERNTLYENLRTLKELLSSGTLLISIH